MNFNHTVQRRGGPLQAASALVLTGVLAGSLALAAEPASAALISVDFGTTTTVGPDGGPSPTTAGPEAAATAANAGFGAASVWNGLAAGADRARASPNPSFSGLRDSTGAATGVGLSLTGAVTGFSGFNNPSADALRKDYLFFNSGNNPATTLSWTLTGLIAGGSYDMFFYGSNAGNAGWSMALGAANQVIGAASGTAYFGALVADANGSISGSLLPSAAYDPSNGFADEVNWSGFQLLSTEAIPTSVPEPAGLALVGVALLGLVFSRRSRRRQA